MQAETSTVSLTPHTAPSHQGLTLVGRSWAGDGTSCFVPELHCLWDCGAVVTPRTPHAIFITHTHADHVQMLPYLLHRATVTDQPIPLYLPAAFVSRLRDYLHAHQHLVQSGGDDDDDNDTDYTGTDTKMSYSRPLYERCTLVPVQPGDELTVRIPARRDPLLVRVVACHHRIDCVGYSCWEQQTTLRPEYRGQDVAALRKQMAADALFRTTRRPLFCFLGDTTHRVWTQHAELLQQHHVIVVECTFLDNATVNKAVATRHMHWKELQPIVNAHPNVWFVLLHGSLRYSSLQRLRFFQPPDVCPHRNVHVLVRPEDVAREWQRERDKNANKTNVRSEEAEELAPPTCQCVRCQPSTGV
jgi:ribonuclease Z